MKRSIKIDGRVIEYELERKSVKNLNLRIRRDGTVYVSVPRSVSVARIEEFVTSHADFIIRALEGRGVDHTGKVRLPEYDNGEVISVLGRDYRIIHTSGTRGTAELCCDALILTLRVGAGVEERRALVRELLDKTAESAVRAACERILPLFAPTVKSMPQIKFRRMVSQWGNCRAKSGILTFNKALAEVPLDCVEYVVMHEFTHFLHQNHSAAFYAEMKRRMPDHAERSRRLNRLGASVITRLRLEKG